MASTRPTSVVFTLSDNAAIESILTDIPFFCVGLMAFGVFTFVLIMKRVGFIAIYLYISSFLAFAASIIDLGQILAQTKTNTISKISPGSVQRLVIAREVGLALSVGFTYIFLWCLVAQRPYGEDSPSPDGAGYDPRNHAHSASWQRWGILGMLLKWTLLGLSFSIPILQIVWRVPAHPQSGTVYIAEATIEVVVSALFILKLLLNISLSPATPWWRPIQSYATPIVGLLISASLGIGNLITFALSETTLGRFLRAVEIYILILFVLIIAFYQVSVSRTTVHSEDTRLMDTSRESKNYVNLATVKTMENTNHRVSTQNDEVARHSHLSVISRLSLRAPLRTSRHPERQSQLHTQDSELGLYHSPVVDTAESSQSRIRDTKGISMSSQVSDPTRYSGDQTPGKGRPLSTAPITSHDAMEHDAMAPKPMPVATFVQDIDSPTYGLHNVRSSWTSDTQSRPRSSAASFDELLRQQKELDKSIANLKLFSSDAQFSDASDERAFPVLSIPKVLDTAKGRPDSVVTLSYLGLKPDSASGRSEFSLSIFPEPPAVDAPAIAPVNKLEMLKKRPRVRRPEIPVSTIELAENSAPLPHSDTAKVFDSAEIQYDVTSFIDGQLHQDLAIPKNSALNNEKRLSDTERGDEVLPISLPRAASPAPDLRPMILGSSIPVLGSPGAEDTTTTALSSILEESYDALSLKRVASVPLRPLLLGRPSVAVPITLSSRTKIPIGPRRKNGLPSNPRRPVISRPLPRDSGHNQAPGVFESPRSPPLRST